MTFKRYSKLLLVVLALALWANTAYAINLLTTDKSGAVTLTYAQFGGVTTTDVIVSAVDTVTPYTVAWNAAGLPTWLRVTCPSTPSTTVTCAVAVDRPAADALTVLPTDPYTLVFTADGADDISISVTPSFTAGFPVLTATAPAPISYTKFQAGVASTSITITAGTEDRTTYTDVYTLAGLGSCPWLSALSTNTSATDGSGHITNLLPSDTLTFTVLHPEADALATGPKQCPVILTLPSGAQASTNITLNIGDGTSVLSITDPPNPAALTYTQFTAGAVTVPLNIVSNNDVPGFTDTYTAATTCGPWLTLKSTSTGVAGGNVTIAGDTLNLVLDRPLADALASQPSACKVTVSPTSGAALADVNVQLTLTAAKPTLLITPSTPATLVYTQFTAGIVKADLVISSPNDDRAAFSDAYTVTTTCGSWLTLQSTSTTSATGGNVTASGDTLKLIVAHPAANALSVSPSTCAVTVTNTASGVALSPVNVSLTLTTATPTLTASSNPIIVNFAKDTSTGSTVTLAVTSNDDTATADNYTITPNASCTWLTLGSLNKPAGPGGQVISQADTLSFAVKTSVAVNLPVVDQSGCLVALTYGATPIASVPVTLHMTNTGNVVTFLSAPQTAIPMGYVKNGQAGSQPANATAPLLVSTTDTVADTYTVTISSCPWLTVSAGPYTAVAGTPQTLTFGVNPAIANAMKGGVATPCSVVLEYQNTMFATVPMNFTVAATASPLTSTPTAITLTYVYGVVTAQPAATKSATINSDDTAQDTFTVLSPSDWPTWLTVAPAAGLHASKALGNVTTFTAGVNSLAVGTYPYTVRMPVDANNLPDLQVLVTLNVVQQPLLPSPTSVALGFTKGDQSLTTMTTTIKVAVGTTATAFTLNKSSIPVWLKAPVLVGASADSSTGVVVSFVGISTTVLQGMAAGNYTANVEFLATGFPTKLTVPVIMTISDTGGAISLLEGTNEIDIFTPPGTVPVPKVTPKSNSGPLAFTAVCAVASAAYTGVTPCQMTTGALNFVPLDTITGVAYNMGTPITTILDPALFTNRPLGTVIALTVTITYPSHTLSLTYKYTLQYGTAMLSITSPTAVQSNLASLGNPLVVTLTGSNYVAPGDLAAGSTIVGTQVFVGGINRTNNSVVLNPTTIMVTVPTTDFPLPPTKGTSSPLVIGVANQKVSDTGAPATPQSTYTLNFSTLPVIYAVTSTASYNQPLPGGKPQVAPYELVSIFGGNFGVTTTNGSATNGTGTLDSFGRYLTTVNASGDGSKTNAYVALKVTFKTGKTTWSAPILFANATQINAIVPSQVTLNLDSLVTVTYGAGSSDGLFGVSIVPADLGIFTLASSGVGPGAILNQDYSVNSSLIPAKAGDVVSIYMTGMGIPTSTADNLASATPPTGFPAACVAVSSIVKGHPGYMEVVNTKITAAPLAQPAILGYTPPSPAWANIDGAVLNAAKIVTGLYPPCFTDTVSVTFGSGLTAVTQTSDGTASSPVYWVGFGSGSVAGLYQVSVKVPNGLTGVVPVQIGMNGATSQPMVVTMVIQ